MERPLNFLPAEKAVDFTEGAALVITAAVVLVASYGERRPIIPDPAQFTAGIAMGAEVLSTAKDLYERVKRSRNLDNKADGKLELDHPILSLWAPLVLAVAGGTLGGGFLEELQVVPPITLDWFNALALGPFPGDLSQLLVGFFCFLAAEKAQEKIYEQVYRRITVLQDPTPEEM